MSQIGVDVGSYTFNPGSAGSGTITFSGVTVTDIEQIKPIVNGDADTANSVIFNPAQSGRFGTFSANVLTLDFDTSTMDASDKLYICVNIPSLSKTSSKYAFSEYNASLAVSSSIDSGWIDMQSVDKYQFEGVSTVAGMTLLIDSSNIDGGGQTTDISSSTLIDISTFHLFSVPARQRFIRFRWQNTTGGVVGASLSIKQTFGSSDKASIFPVYTEPSQFSQAALSQAILKGDDGTELRTIGSTPGGNLKITAHDAQTGSRQIVDLNGAAKVGEAIILSGDVLYGQDLSSILWNTLSINGGTTTGGAGERILETNTAANGEMIIQSRKRSRFMIAQFNINHFGIQLDPVNDLIDPDTIFEWGSVDFLDDAGALNLTPNGIFIRVIGNATEPEWYIVSVKNGVETVLDSSLWNGTNAFLLDKEPLLSVYEMQYNAGTAFFFQNGNFLHRLQPAGASTYAANYNFPVAVRIRNINGNTTNHQIATRAAGTYRLGEERGELISRAFTANTLVKTGAGYIGKASLSRTGSSGGSGTANIYDGVDATGVLIGRIDVGGDDVKGITLDGTYSTGLYITIAGSGTNTLTINFE